MKYSELGNTGMQVSRTGFGTWAMSGPNSPSFWGPQDDEASIQTIRHGIEQGINWIDTAAIYGMGHAERVVAEAVSVFGGDDRPFVFTKAGLRWDAPGPSATVSKQGSPESLRYELDASLERLGVEQIDLYQMHWPANDVEVEAYWSVFDEFLSSGKVRAIGVSNHSVEQLDRAEAVGRLHTNQAPLSLLRPDSTTDLLPWAIDHGVGTLVYSPMASGLLTGKFSASGLESLDEKDWRRSSPLFTPQNLAKVDDLVKVLENVADVHGASVSSVAIAWVLAQRGVTAAIVGARTPEQVDAWVGAGDLELSPAELEQIEVARQRYASI